MTDTLAVPQGLLGKLGGFIVWLGGALASITAIFYATGYLITRAHLSMLGLYGVVVFNADQLVQEGGRFFLVTGYAAVTELALPLLALFGVVSIGAMLLRRLLLFRFARWQGWWRHWRARLPAPGPQAWPRLLAFAGLFGAFIWHADTFLPKFQQPLCISDLLYADRGRVPCQAPSLRAGACRLKTALLGRDERMLHLAFEELLVGFALALVLAWLTWRVTLPWRGRACYVAPSAFAAAVYLVLLPMDYGVLQRPIVYPRVALTLEAHGMAPMGAPLFLLNQTSNEFIVWDALQRKLFWIPTRLVQRAVVDGSYDLFDRLARDREQP